jgi:hypothetical protein
MGCTTRGRSRPRRQKDAGAKAESIRRNSICGAAFE